MDKLNYTHVEDFLSHFDEEKIPVMFIDYIIITYKNDTEKKITGDKVRQLFPHITHATRSTIRDSEEILSAEFVIDKSLVLRYLLDIERDIIDVINETIDEIKKRP